MSQSTVDYLSCDSADDAIRSLALAYNVEKEKIIRVFQEDWPDFLHNEVENEVFQDELLTWCMAQHMRCDDIKDSDVISAYYHRGLFNGDKNWFHKGLLNSLDGTASFLDYLRPMLPSNCDFSHIKALALSNVLDRTQGESEWGGGPYAFDRLDDAKGAQETGLDYSTPEFLMGRFWDSKSNDRHCASTLIKLSRDNFLPVVVKFTADNSRAREYVSNLWHYLHRKKFQIDLEPNYYTFIGRGLTVPKERILELIIVL